MSLYRRRRNASPPPLVVPRRPDQDSAQEPRARADGTPRAPQSADAQRSAGAAEDGFLASGFVGHWSAPGVFLVDACAPVAPLRADGARVRSAGGPAPHRCTPRASGSLASDEFEVQPSCCS
jgi:hypothetical protein